MIYLIVPGNFENSATLVAAALVRSCGAGQVSCVNINEWISLRKNSKNLISVFINPLEAWASQIVKTLLKSECKTLIFGALPITLIKHFNMQVGPITEEIIRAVECVPAAAYSSSSSALRIRYQDIQGLHSPVASRACVRYDFTDEWNNLGFGAITANGSIWSLSQSLNLDESQELATLMIEDRKIGAYAGVWSNDSYVKGMVLWFNRPVGPIDSQEWRIVERFLSSAGYPECACHPVVLEIPEGYDAAVTMRLDCDEDVESSRTLWELYKSMEVPFSLALHSKVLEDPKHHILPRDVLRGGGAILSHTATHALNWGGSYEAAYKEASVSADVIATATGYRVRYAVSPFHQTPTYARSALADAGYDGCIGGIIKNDYDFLMARSGVPPFGVKGFIGHSQQCMFHGDCILKGEEPLMVYKEAFELARASKTFFGYLDHPFSERYQYGWSSEDHRVDMHKSFIEYIRKQGKILFLNEVEAMDFLHDRAAIRIEDKDNQLLFRMPAKPKSSFKQSIEYGGEILVLNGELSIS
jgi:hypothetical protein